MDLKLNIQITLIDLGILLPQKYSEQTHKKYIYTTMTEIAFSRTLVKISIP